MRLALGPLLVSPLLCQAAVIVKRAAADHAAADHVAARAASFPGPWVTIDASSMVSTVTPLLSSASTISAPPSVLTQPTAYVLSLDGHATTTTAAPPVVSATGPGPAGAFMRCTSDRDILAPEKKFCQPQPGTQLLPDRTYYVVWDPYGFAPNQTVQLEAEYGSGGDGGYAVGGEQGFVTELLLASRGFYAWTVASDFLLTQTASPAGRVNVTLSLLYNASTIPGPEDADGSGSGSIQLLRIGGPSVLVTAEPALPKQHRKHVVAVAVAVPVVVGVVAVLALLSYCVWSYRHHGHLPCVGELVSRRTSSFSAKGYSVRQSYGQRTGNSGGWDFKAPVSGLGGRQDEDSQR
ncbi:MAG: hypothetical protein STHCBS139747_005014 [Sporothrix thermara]